ncbi:MAG: hypothetical protein J6Y69_10310 [Treponema sp.]|nr:hypothetical protein [Treponema sp.]
MSFYSQVQITAEPDAFVMFKDTLDKHKLKYEVSGTDDSRVINIEWVKWYPEFDVVSAVDDVSHKLNDIDEEGYGYKMIVLNEDNTSETYCNNQGDSHFYDVGVQCYIDNPYNV